MGGVAKKTLIELATSGTKRERIRIRGRRSWSGSCTVSGFVVVLFLFAEVRYRYPQAAAAQVSAGITSRTKDIWTNCVPLAVRRRVTSLVRTMQRCSVDIGSEMSFDDTVWFKRPGRSNTGTCSLGDGTWTRLGRIHPLFSELAEWSPKKKTMWRGANSAYHALAEMVHLVQSISLPETRLHRTRLSYERHPQPVITYPTRILHLGTRRCM